MAQSKILLVYYSRTVTTRKLGQVLAKALNCDVEEIVDPRPRQGFSGYLAVAPRSEAAASLGHR